MLLFGASLSLVFESCGTGFHLPAEGFGISFTESSNGVKGDHLAQLVLEQHLFCFQFANDVTSFHRTLLDLLDQHPFGISHLLVHHRVNCFGY